mgnify:CR=1 FL=1
MSKFTQEDSKEICEILERRANEIAMFLADYRKDEKHFGSIELALSREIDRLRGLSEKLSDLPDSWFV